jgi:hypothetical protein
LAALLKVHFGLIPIELPIDFPSAVTVKKERFPRSIDQVALVVAGTEGKWRSGLVSAIGGLGTAPEEQDGQSQNTEVPIVFTDW